MQVGRIHLIRHGVSEANLRRMVCGQLDSPLASEGREELKRVSCKKSYKEINQLKCFSSPLLRATETAKGLGFDEFELIPEFMETNIGDYSSRNFEELAKEHPEFNHYHTDLLARYPGGESTGDMINRAVRKIKEIIDKSSEQEIVIVCHKGPMNAIVGTLLGVSFESFPMFLFENYKIK